MQRVWRTVTGFYHVCARGTGKQLIFEGDEDRWEFLELMRECCRKAGVTVIAWCLMGNHVRLVLADYEDAMSAAMHRLLLTYARRFNKRTGRTGHLFQNRFDRRSLDTDWQVMEAIRSVHANPQEAGIALVECYPWSSFAEYLRAYDNDMTRGFSDPSCVLELFGSAKAFIVYSLSTLDDGESAMPDLEETEWERHAFAEKLAKGLGVPLDVVKAASSAQRNTVILGLHDAGFTVRQIERYTGIGKSTVSRIVHAYAQVDAQAEGSK
ncbi:transposase [Collinsella aerofaciens]|uniref:transposase n=1 Tax=Collinsella aerofaciens TaxID=74426 RepID=UPI00189D8FEC|nr:transposase [Collinsella aerofaciens]MDB1885735.1 transposase [Collinsella aerofaciens]MDB1889521.1 transposase [Collinsella aerofaciens]MDB1891381.1 transposase [Collinsella aerofaciens]